MKFGIVIPAHNEARYLRKTLDSLVSQTLLPQQIVVVDDGSTDDTGKIIAEYAAKYPFIKGSYHDSEQKHAPGSKVIRAFYHGLDALDADWEVVCKFDADLVFPKNYLEVLSDTFAKDDTIGMAGGFCYIEKNGHWELENLTNKDHLRGALKAYRKACFEAIGGLKNAMGWDTIDELLAQYHGWKIQTLPTLQVKHCKPTGNVYTAEAKLKQGEAFYRMRYGYVLTVIASAKLAVLKNNRQYFFDCLKGYRKAKSVQRDFLVSEAEGKFIRQLRYRNILKKLKFSR